nr:D424 [uncultured bacterium]
MGKWFAALVPLCLAPLSCLATDGQVLDAASGAPIAGATVTVGDTVAHTDEIGHFNMAGTTDTLAVRAPGYGRLTVPAAPLTALLEVRLPPLRPKALYLSSYGVGNRALRQAALDLIDRTEINALVLDVKGDRGFISYPSAVPLAAQVGALHITTVPDIRALLAQLKARGVYLIARIVVFKDQPYANARPDLTVKTAAGAVWHDREGLAWTDPFRREVWDYNLAIAEEAAQLGFDEIQFDYLRFPDAPGLVYAEPNNEANRVAAITGFAAAARRRLAPYNVFLAVDVFGYVCWNLDDTHIGQRLGDLASQVDYLSPMLYPSGFQFGIPGYPNPVTHVQQIVGLSLARAARRTGLPAARFRPWLQAFKDYAFDRRAFTGADIRTQIDAAEHFGSAGWMLWNPRNQYRADGLQAEPAVTP